MSIGLKLVDKKRIRPTVVCGPGRTKSEFKDECNINKMMAKYENIGIPAPVQQRFADVANYPDLQTAFAVVHQSEEDFMNVPVHIRKRFDHNPIKLFEFLNDPSNREEAVKLGLCVSRVKPPQDEAVRSSEAGASSPASEVKK